MPGCRGQLIIIEATYPFPGVQPANQLSAMLTRFQPIIEVVAEIGTVEINKRPKGNRFSLKELLILDSKTLTVFPDGIRVFVTREIYSCVEPFLRLRRMLEKLVPLVLAEDTLPSRPPRGFFVSEFVLERLVDFDNDDIRALRIESSAQLANVGTLTYCAT